MRGAEPGQRAMFSYVDLEQRDPRLTIRSGRFRRWWSRCSRELSPRFAALYAESGRPSIPPEQLLRALLLQVLYTIRSERQLMEQLDYNLLFRWFVGLGMDAPVWHPTTFTKNRDRLLAGQIAEAFFAGVLRQAGSRALLSHEHFTVDGTLLEAWASQKSFRPTDAPPPRRRRSGQSDGELPGRAPLERDPSLGDRSRRAAGEEERGEGSQAQLSGECAAGQPPRPGGGDDGQCGRARVRGSDGRRPPRCRDTARLRVEHGLGRPSGGGALPGDEPRAPDPPPASPHSGLGACGPAGPVSFLLARGIAGRPVGPRDSGPPGESSHRNPGGGRGSVGPVAAAHADSRPRPGRGAGVWPGSSAGGIRRACAPCGAGVSRTEAPTGIPECLGSGAGRAHWSRGYDGIPHSCRPHGRDSRPGRPNSDPGSGLAARRGRNAESDPLRLRQLVAGAAVHSSRREYGHPAIALRGGRMAGAIGTGSPGAAR